MERKRQFFNEGKLLSKFGSEAEKYFYNEKLFNSFTHEQSVAEEYYKKDKKKTPKTVDLWTDSDEEFKAELENAVEQYKKNIKKNEVELGSNQCKKEGKYESKKNQNPARVNIISSDFTKIKNDDISDGNPAMDVHELINYFFLRKKDKSEKSKYESYIDYEKQGAIPKNIMARRKASECNREKSEVQIDVKKHQKKVREVFPMYNQNQPRIKENSSEYTFLKQSNSDEIIIKINEKICSKPFFYIVPENPSPNFFLPRGSYYVIPKIPSSIYEDKIFFHPENGAGAECELNCSLLSPQVEFNKVIPSNKNNLIQNLRIPTNNLGKEVFQKTDSHLNIGPVDVKLSDSNNNLDTNFNSNKVFSKSVLNFNSLSASRGFLEEKPTLKSDLVKIETEDSNSVEEIRSDFDDITLHQLNKTLQTLLSEIPNLDTGSANRIALEYLNDEDGLKNYIISAHLKKKIETQLGRMIFALPENSLDELRDKCIEFQGEEELVSNFIKETQQVNKISQQILDMQLVFPDADPYFLREEIEKLNGDDEAINILTDQLLDNKDYPKIIEDSLNAERRKMWREYVEKFNVQNFIFEVPKPGNFAGEVGDNNKTDLELILKFLQSRYPSQSRDFLIQTFESNNKNVTKTCDSLRELECISLKESSFRNEAFSKAFLEEIIYIDHKEEIERYLKEIKEWKEMEIEEARLNDSFLYCPLCSDDELVASQAICCLDGHIFCKDCIKRYISVKMGDGVFKFACPLEFCDTFFSYKILQEVLSQNILSKIVNKQQAEEISKAEVDGLESCPYCEFAYIPNPQDKIFKCQNPSCLIETCRNCHEKNHIPLRCEEIERSIDVEARKKIEESMTQQLVRICPKCQKKFVKIDGCNKMVCVCGEIMCYVCRKRVEGYDHFRQNKCPLYSNNIVLHEDEVFQAGIRTRNEIQQENENIRILYDPTVRK